MRERRGRWGRRRAPLARATVSADDAHTPVSPSDSALAETGDRGLVPFDVPRFLDQASTRPDGLAAVAGGVVANFITRAAVLCCLAAVVPVVNGRDIRVELGVVVVATLPLATVLERRRVGDGAIPVASRSLSGEAAGLILVDVCAVIAIAALGETIEIAIAVGLATVAFHRYSYARAGAIMSLCLVTAGVASLTIAGLPGTTWLDPVLVFAVGATLVSLVGSQALAREQSRAGLHLANEKAAAVLAGIGDAIVLADTAGVILETNPAADRLLGRQLGETLAPCADQLSLHRDGEALQCRDGCALLACDGPTEVWRTGPKGERQPLLANAVALTDASGTPVEIVHSLRDITSIKAADEAKSLFLATSSHELKTPLAVIRGFAQLLAAHDLDPATRTEALGSIERRSAELAAIIDRLLMSSRIEAGRVDLQVDVHPIVDLVRRRVEEFEKSTDLAISLVYDPSTPAAWCDPVALITVMDHLLDNARKYAPNEPRLQVEVGGDPSGGVFLAITDNGVGMTEDEITRCFDHFWQAEGTDVRRFGGTGVGLYIVRALVIGMDGDIAVQSTPGSGSTFTVRLRHEAPCPIRLVDDGVDTVGVADGEPSMIREFMRQVGLLDTGQATR